ncbi:hypothetical protein D030_1775A, partial [Vibrio parahaemolyticus AQ3810]
MGNVAQAMIFSPGD